MNQQQQPPHALEDAASWKAHVDRVSLLIQHDNSNSNNNNHQQQDDDVVVSRQPRHRNLKHRHHDKHRNQNNKNHHHADSSSAHLAKLEQDKEDEFWTRTQHAQQDAALKHDDKRAQRLHKLWANPGISRSTVHGIMIDAGSKGSRLHVYEWEPRILTSPRQVQDAVAGNQLTFPGTESRWTDRLQPGISSFADIPDDDELQTAIRQYLQPLLEFATTILSSKQDDLQDFPIFLRATAGMRILDPADRARVMKAIEQLFHDKTYCPFRFVDEQARVLSGEEEAIFDWTGVNFLLGDLIDASQGAGTVVAPRLTHGALDLGGASTQIGFYEPSEDIMSNLFKLQIGQAKHWNLYAHSFLFYGMDEAMNRFHAQLAAGKTIEERVVQGVYNPCLPGGSQVQVRTNIHMTNEKNPMETWEYGQNYPSGNGYYQAVLRNDHKRGDPTECLDLTQRLLHLDENAWCNFAHQGDCSLAGIYQPPLPRQTQNVGEFVAFSNYYHIWQFLHLPERATIAQLKNATEYVCAMSHDELVAFDNGAADDPDDLDSYCFRAAYAFSLLHNGYGFQMDDTIRATQVINGQKVGWALGAMIYEINAMPWTYVGPHRDDFVLGGGVSHQLLSATFVGVVVAMVVSLVCVLSGRRSRYNAFRQQYEPIKEVAV